MGRKVIVFANNFLLITTHQKSYIAMDQKRIYPFILTLLTILALMTGDAVRTSPARAAEGPVKATSGYATWTTAGYTQVSVPASRKSGLSFDVDSPLAPTAVCTPDVNDLRAYWRMDDASTPLTDSIANPINNNGSCTGDLCPNPNPTGKVNSAFDFNNDEVNVTDTSGLDFTIAGNMTVETWVKTPQDQDCTDNIVFIGRYQGSTAPNSSAWWLGCGTDGLTTEGLAAFNLRDNTGVKDTLLGTSQINDGNWHHVVATHEGSTKETKIYSDGVLEATTTVNYTGELTFTHEINIGYFDVAPFYYFIGTLDEMALYDRVLTAEEVARHYFTGIGQSYCNDPPIANPDTLDATEDTILNIAITDLTGNDVDPEGDTFSITAIDNSTSAGGTITGTGPYTYTPPENFNGADTFHYTIADATGPDTATVTINVAATNNAPVVTNPGDQTNLVTDDVSLQIVASDPDGDDFTCSAENLPAGLEIKKNAHGCLVESILPEGSQGTYDVSITATDVREDSKSTTIEFKWFVLKNAWFVYLPVVINEP